MTMVMALVVMMIVCACAHNYLYNLQHPMSESLSCLASNCGHTTNPHNCYTHHRVLISSNKTLLNQALTFWWWPQLLFKKNKTRLGPGLEALLPMVIGQHSGDNESVLISSTGSNFNNYTIIAQRGKLKVNQNLLSSTSDISVNKDAA